MHFHRTHVKEGFLAFRLHFDPTEVKELEAKLGHRIVFSERFKTEHVLAGIYEIPTGGLEIGLSTWLPTKAGHDPLTILIRPMLMPMIEAEVVKIDEERSQELLAEARERGWVVLERPSEALRAIAERAAAGDTDAVEALERLGAEECAPFASSGM